MFDKAKALEAARAKLARQQETLKETLGQIDYVAKTYPNMTNATASLRSKRDRQQLAIRATEQLIEIYSDKKK